MKMNKAFDLKSISVFPPNLRRRSSVGPSEPQASQQSLSQGPSSQRGCFSQMTQSSVDQRFTCQERDLSLKKTSFLAPVNHKRDDTQMLSSRPSSGRWSSVSFAESKSQISEERFGMMETSLSKFGMMLDSFQTDIIQANRGTKQVFLETERLHQKLLLQDTSLQQLIKEQTDVKASLDGAVKSVLEELTKFPNQEKLQKIALMLTAIPEQVETSLQKIQSEICHKLTGDIQVLASLKMTEPVIAQEVPTAPQVKKSKENLHEQRGPAAKLQSSAFCDAILKTKQPRLHRNPDKTSARNVKTFLSPKTQVGCWKTVKPAQRTSKNNTARKQVKPVGTRTQFEECSIVIDSDEDIDEGFSCLLKGNTKGASFEWDAKKETERLLKTARRTRRKFVVEFLGNVPLLQKLPSSSLKKIAQVVVLKRYARGEYVIREEQAWDGCYFIFSGEAQVSGPEEEENRSEFLLKQYDYFGHGISAHVHSADIIATSELTCLVLPRDHCRLLETNSIWQSDQEVDKCSLVERILHLDPLELNIFRGITLPDAPIFGKVFGGQFMGQALAAASKTVDFRKIVHSFHSYFLLVGDIDIPIIYQVHRIRDGNNFATRRVDAIQKGNIIFILMASFQKEQQGFDHQESTMPSAPDPDTLLSLEELRERRITDPQLPRSYRNKVATANFIPWPIEIRFCEPSNSTNQTKSPPRLRYWFRAKGKLSDDQALHRCVVAFASDLIFASISLNPHRRKGLRSAALSLDHAMWFHRPLRADDWLLFVIVSPTAHMTRGFVTGEMFNRKGELDDWVLCRIYNKKGAIEKRGPPPTPVVYGDEVVEEKPRLSEMGMPPPPVMPNDFVYFDTSDSVPKLHTTESSCSEQVVSPEFTSEVQSEPKWKDWSGEKSSLDFGFNYIDATAFGGGGGSNQLFPLQDMFMYNMPKPY
ncbi:unnamed protein product [Brassica rapa subsp. narinosa]